MIAKRVKLVEWGPDPDQQSPEGNLIEHSKDGLPQLPIYEHTFHST